MLVALLVNIITQMSSRYIIFLLLTYVQTNSCQNNVAGQIVQRVARYFFDNATATLPAVFFTGCSGPCGSPGWRTRGVAVDSGYPPADSKFTLF